MVAFRLRFSKSRTRHSVSDDSRQLCACVLVTRLNSQTYTGHLNLASNRFHGSLSTSLGLLTRLEFIDLSFNEMSGSLPDELGQLSELATLTLADNDFTNQLPTTLVQLTRLQMLDIRNNAFVGTITDTICQDLVFLNEIRVDCSSTFATGNCTCCVCSDTGMNAT